ncbi:MAG: hypothetical protein ACI9P5_004747, partial [Saprospiraceae bacterium]
SREALYYYYLENLTSIVRMAGTRFIRNITFSLTNCTLHLVTMMAPIIFGLFLMESFQTAQCILAKISIRKKYCMESG